TETKLSTEIQRLVFLSIWKHKNWTTTGPALSVLPIPKCSLAYCHSSHFLNLEFFVTGSE
ncbi:MAG: hypothetical protein COU68_00800, partial [Candidatus Pacebacteria bacterium CG10_big_fil_rev_8_21_14_0_10_45_6]